MSKPLTEKDLKKLYEEDTGFRLYVDKVCKTYGYTKEFAFKDCIIRNYAEYVLHGQDEYVRKECAREYKQNCGC